MTSIKVAIISSSDKLWGVSAWERFLLLIQGSAKYEITCFIECESKLGSIKQGKEGLWFLHVFGVINTILITLFYFWNLMVRAICLRDNNYNSICHRYNVPYHYVRNPNSKECTDLVSDMKPDILIIMVDHIVRDVLLSIPRIGTINKHASLLPSNRGLFPYFWACIENSAQGISFHVVEEKVDSGELLYQECVSGPVTESLVSFYHYVFQCYPQQLITSLDNIVVAKYVQPMEGVMNSCVSLPTRVDYKLFALNKGKICRVRDVFKIV